MLDYVIKKEVVPTARVFGLGLLCTAIVYLAVIKLPSDALLLSAIDMTGKFVAGAGSIIGANSFYENGFVTVAGYRMHISFECTALHFLVIYLLAVLAWPGHDFRYKLKGLAIGSIGIISVNIFRILTLGLIGAHFPQYFDLLHAYLWQGAFAIIVFLLWVAWVERAYASKPLAWFFLISLVTAAVSVLLISAVLDGYVAILAFAAGQALKLVASLAGTSGLSVDAQAGTIAFMSGGNTTYFPVSVDIYDAVIFVSLMVASIKKRVYFEFFLKSLCVGLAVLLVMHILFVITAGNLVLFSIHSDTVSYVMWILRFISILAPVSLWIFLRRSIAPVRQEPFTFTNSLSMAEETVK